MRLNKVLNLPKILCEKLQRFALILWSVRNYSCCPYKPAQEPNACGFAWRHLWIPIQAMNTNITMNINISQPWIYLTTRLGLFPFLPSPSFLFASLLPHPSIHHISSRQIRSNRWEWIKRFLDVMRQIKSRTPLACVPITSSLVPRLSVGGERESLVSTVCACA